MNRRYGYVVLATVVGALALAFALVPAAPAIADDVPTGYRGAVPLQLEGDGPYYRVVLPFEAHRDSLSARLADVRVLDATGVEQPYALRPMPREERSSRAVLTARLFPLRAPADDPARLPGMTVRRGAGGTVVEIAPDSGGATGQVLRGWLLDLGDDDRPMDKLELTWSSREEGFHVFSIETSDDLNAWSRFGHAQVARLTFNGERIEQNTVNLCCVRARYLRLLWSGSDGDAPEVSKAVVEVVTTDDAPYGLTWSPFMEGALEPLGDAPRSRSSGARSSAARSSPAPFASSTPSSANPSSAGPSSDVAYLWTFPTGLPIEEAQVELPQPLTLAPVVVQGRLGEGRGWPVVGRGLLYRMPSADGDDRAEETLTLSGARVDTVRLAVDTRGGGLGTDAPRMRVALKPMELVFLARGQAPFSLVSGRSDAVDRSLPLNTLVPGYEPRAESNWGAATPDAGWVSGSGGAPPMAGSAFEWKRIALPGMLFLGVALLVAMAFALFRSEKSAATQTDDRD